MSRRVVVTGLGVVAPNGVGVPAFLQAIKNGVSGIQFSPQYKELGFNCQVCGKPDFDWDDLQHYLPEVTFHGLRGSGIGYAIKAAADAWLDAGTPLDTEETRTETGCVFGTSIADQFVIDGEPIFRERERAAVARALAEHSGVLSLGGGAVLAKDTRQLLAEQQVVWLRVSAGEAASRVGMGVSRPLLLGNVRATLVTLLNERAPLYAEVADLTIDTDGMTPVQVVDAIVALLPETEVS
jgi:shikimate kinase